MSEVTCVSKGFIDGKESSLTKFKDGKMSTRKGNLIFLRDVVDRSVELVKETIQKIEKHLRL